MIAGSKRRREDVEDTTLIEDFSKESKGAFHIFPDEILELILKYTDQRILMVLARVSKFWQHFSNTSAKWGEIAKNLGFSNATTLKKADGLPASTWKMLIKIKQIFPKEIIAAFGGEDYIALIPEVNICPRTCKIDDIFKTFSITSPHLFTTPTDFQNSLVIRGEDSLKTPFVSMLTSKNNDDGTEEMVQSLFPVKQQDKLLWCVGMRSIITHENCGGFTSKTEAALDEHPFAVDYPKTHVEKFAFDVNWANTNLPVEGLLKTLKRE